ncbi:hypothetical protein [Flavivirga eckloniae]|uniref:Uncharacterized protein n=1 Tax=Flavivirga eckloniae TaxID=1803846 RepID=A0A2K9PMD7_9FLAO|nr:hypothetical protein [Flavivirga eckloniae]AUP78233.1 hypothetical protein C1H87_05665 [Flavivirga eckloniae]
MKKSSLLLSSLILTICLFVSCGSSTEVSPEMQGFITAISSTKSIDKAAEKYGYSNDEIPLGYYELGEAKVTSSTVQGTKTCYALNVKHGLVDSDINVCWEGAKIISITE